MAERLRPKKNLKLPKTIHTAWGQMKNRCYNKKSPDYKNWGGRGIIVCEDWQYYEGFYNDMISGYKKGLTLDRIDNNGNYCKENCRWVDRKIQNRNRRDNNNIEYMGEVMPLTSWSYKLNIKSSTLRQRYYVLHKRGDSLFKPTRTYERN